MQQDEHDKFEIPLGTPQFSQTNATKIDDVDNADFELDMDCVEDNARAQAYRTEPLPGQTG